MMAGNAPKTCFPRDHDFGQLVKTLFPEKRLAIVQTSSEGKLQEDLANAFQEHGRVRSILIVGHSNEAGLVLTGDGLRTWSVVGNWLQKFEPEFCFLAACRAGRSEAVRDLFKRIKTLRQIYASPTVLYKNQTPPAFRTLALLQTPAPRRAPGPPALQRT